MPKGGFSISDGIERNPPATSTRPSGRRRPKNAPRAARIGVMAVTLFHTGSKTSAQAVAVPLGPTV